MSKKRKLSIILSGGALYGAYQIGILEALKDYADSLNINLNDRISTIYGASIGALNATCFLEYLIDGNKNKYWISNMYNDFDLSKIIKCDGLDNKDDIFSKKNRYIFIKNLLKSGAFDSSELKELIKNYIDMDIISKSKVDLGIVLTKGIHKYDIYNKEKINGDYEEVISASCAFPIIFKPISINNIKYTDGGIGNYLPINDVADDDILIIEIPMIKKDKRILDTIKSDEYNVIVMESDLIGHFELYKKIIDPSKRNLILYRPKELKGGLFDPRYTKDNIERGIKDIYRTKEDIKKLLKK